ncbi:MAG: ABC transporter substrate-binding protein [Actinomycetota bacterium]
MRKMFAFLAVGALLFAACGEDNPTVGGSGGTGASASGPTGSTAPATAAECAAASQDALVAPGVLTIGTDNPAFPPWFSGGETDAHSEWKFDDPYTGKGYEAATAYAVAEAMGFTKDQVQWVVAPFNQTYKPGDKDYDFAIEQISYSAKRDEAVDFSESYYDVQQALVAVKGSPIAAATSIADLAGYTIAAPIGTTSYDYIVANIPDATAGSYTTLSDTVAALNAGQVDAIVVDAPTAFYLADPFVQEVKDGVVVGLFPPAGEQEYFGLTFVTGSPLLVCANLALEEIKADGTLDAIHQKWLVENTNVGQVPEFTT